VQQDDRGAASIRRTQEPRSQRDAVGCFQFDVAEVDVSLLTSRSRIALFGICNSWTRWVKSDPTQSDSGQNRPRNIKCR